MSEILREIIVRNRAGAAAAIPSVCSAHADVLCASMILAQELDQPLMIEATSNQVNQFGGYTGMTPADFVGFVHRLVAKTGTDRARILLGGDHLGPQVWRGGPVGTAMTNAKTLVADYVRAGFTKIHLDCSEGCAGEATQVDDSIAAQRSALLAKACRDAAPDPAAISFVIGTEVPPPGGGCEDEEDEIAPTSPMAAAATLAAHQAAFVAQGLSDLWPQVCGLVVQSGAEFSPASISHLPPSDDPGLRAVLADWPGVCFEAHSTDYQRPAAYPRLAGMGFAIHKVGPALTFAWRQAVYGLDLIAQISGLRLEPLSTVMERTMLARPSYWQGHYHADGAQALRMLRHFSYSDRIRYYWPEPEPRKAVDGLFAALRGRDLPEPALAQCFSPAVMARAKSLAPSYDNDQAQALVAAQVQTALLPYFFGCSGAT